MKCFDTITTQIYPPSSFKNHIDRIPLAMAKSIAHTLPKTLSEWKEAAETEGVLRKSLSASEALPSASKMSLKEYLAMRVLRPRRMRAGKIPVNKALEDRTEKILSDFYAFDHYIAQYRGVLEGCWQTML